MLYTDIIAANVYKSNNISDNQIVTWHFE